MASHGDEIKKTAHATAPCGVRADKIACQTQLATTATPHTAAKVTRIDVTHPILSKLAFGISGLDSGAPRYKATASLVWRDLLNCEEEHLEFGSTPMGGTRLCPGEFLMSGLQSQ